MKRNKPTGLDKHPLILAFVDNLTEEYDLDHRKEIVTVDGGSATVHPVNPPYRSVRYVASFVDNLERILEASGFKCVDRDRYKFEGGNLTAYIDNVDVSDPEEADPIEITFFEP